MESIGYLMRVDLKKHLGGPVEDSRTCFVLPPIAPTPARVDEVGKAFELVVEAMRQASRYPVIEEGPHRRVFIDDLRPLRNALLFEKDGWRCFGVRT